MQLHILLSTLLLDMKHDATDRFMRDSIDCCYGAERFFLLHHTLHDGRPQVSWNTVVRMFRPWSSALEKRRVPPLNEFISCQKVVHLQIQFPRRGKEEVKNWRKRIRHPSVPSQAYSVTLDKYVTTFGCHVFLLFTLEPPQNSTHQYSECSIIHFEPSIPMITSLQTLSLARWPIRVKSSTYILIARFAMYNPRQAMNGSSYGSTKDEPYTMVPFA
jgi:hypothetical protein